MFLKRKSSQFPPPQMQNLGSIMCHIGVFHLGADLLWLLLSQQPPVMGFISLSCSDVRILHHLSLSPGDQTCCCYPKAPAKLEEMQHNALPGAADTTSGSALCTTSGSPPCSSLLHLTPVPFHGPLPAPKQWLQCLFALL